MTGCLDTPTSPIGLSSAINQLPLEIRELWNHKLKWMVDVSFGQPVHYINDSFHLSSSSHLELIKYLSASILRTFTYSVGTHPIHLPPLPNPCYHSHPSDHCTFAPLRPSSRLNRVVFLHPNPPLFTFNSLMTVTQFTQPDRGKKFLAAQSKHILISHG
jgi:hypothetical protein